MDIGFYILKNHEDWILDPFILFSIDYKLLLYFLHNAYWNIIQSKLHRNYAVYHKVVVELYRNFLNAQVRVKMVYYVNSRCALSVFV